MPSRRKGRQKGKPAHPAPAAKENPSYDSRIPPLLDLNYSDKVAGVLNVYYSIATDVVSGVALSESKWRHIQALEKKVDRLYQDILISQDERVNDILALAQVYYYATYPYLTDDAKQLAVASRYIKRSGELLVAHELARPDVFEVAIRVYELAGLVCIKRKRYKLAVRTMERAFVLYDAFMSGKDAAAHRHDVRSTRLAECEVEGCMIRKMQCIFWLMLRQLVTVCKSEELRESHRFRYMAYKRMYLKQQLIVSPEPVDKHDLIRSSLYLVKLFLMYGRLKEAKEHIAIACIINERLLREGDAEHRKSLCLMCKFITMEINIHIATYGIWMLRLSSKRLLGSRRWHGDTMVGDFESVPKFVTSESMKQLIGDEECDLSRYTSMNVDTLPVDYNSAKEIFANTLMCLEKAKAVYNSYPHLSNFANIMLHFYEAYESFGYHEVNKETRMEIYVRQNSILDSVISFKNDTPADWYKYVLLRKAFVANAMLEITYEEDAFDEDLEPAGGPKIQSNIKQLAETSVKYFQQYLQSKL